MDHEGCICVFSIGEVVFKVVSIDSFSTNCVLFVFLIEKGTLLCQYCWRDQENSSV